MKKLWNSRKRVIAMIAANSFKCTFAT